MEPTPSTSYWQSGLNILMNAAQGGAFGSTVARYTGAPIINQPNPIAAPNPAPPPPPVSGQQGTNPAEPSGGFMDHMREHWGKYALGLSVIGALFVVVKIARR